jgi:hypothetical protein
LALLFLAESTAPLALRAHRLRPALLETASVEDEHAVRAAHLGGKLPTHLRAQRAIVPLARADEVLQRPSLLPAFRRDRLGCAPRELPKSAVHIYRCVFPLLPSQEQSQKWLEKALQPLFDPFHHPHCQLGLRI